MSDIHLYGVILKVLTHDFFRYLIGAGGVYLVVNVMLARRLASRKIRAGTPGWPQIRREVFAGLRTVLIFAAVGVGVTLLAIAGLLPVYARVSEYSWLWLVVSILVIIVVHDAYFYWAHWLMHRAGILRRLHLLHHKSHNPTAFTSYSFDAGEALVHALFLPAFLVLIPMHPLAIFMFMNHMMLRNAVGHCGVELFPAGAGGRPLVTWMTTVTHHDLHHAHAGTNLGLYFTWWDRWMGTEHPQYIEAFQSASGLPVGARAQSGRG